MKLEMLAAAYEHVIAGTVVIDTEGRILVFTESAQRIFGYVEEEVVGRNVRILMPEPFSSEHDQYLSRYAVGAPPRIIGKGREVLGRRKGGTTFPMHLGVGQAEVDGRRVFVGSITDLEGRKLLESQLVRAQRMEAVGKLTGGVAHDFNNLLLVIGAHAEILEEIVAESLPHDAQAKESLAAIGLATKRATSLTSQLLSFARRQTLASKPISVSERAVELSRMLGRTFPETITLELALEEGDGCWANLDASLLDNALLNVLLNARDAMPEGGTLRVLVGAVTLERGTLAWAPEVTGDFVRVQVDDSGAGIPEADLERVVEPFFTTKSRADSSGLGLSMVYGFVKQSGGHLQIRSEVGSGTSVILYFPRLPAPPRAGSDEQAAGPALAGSQRRLLLVEDEPGIRRALLSLLRRHGWQTTEADDVSRAEALLARDGFDVLLTDVVLPGGRNGFALARESRRRFPEMRIILTTGYSELEVPADLKDDPAVALLKKPYRLAQLAHLLAQGAPPERPATG